MANTCLAALTVQLQNFTQVCQQLSQNGRPRQAVQLITEAQNRFLHIVNNHGNCQNPCIIDLPALQLVDPYVIEYGVGLQGWDDVRNITIFTSDFTNQLYNGSPPNSPPDGFLFNLCQFLSNRRHERNKVVYINNVQYIITVRKNVVRGVSHHNMVFVFKSDRIGCFLDVNLNETMDHWMSVINQLVIELKYEESRL